MGLIHGRKFTILNLVLALALGMSPQPAKPATNVQCPVMGAKVTESNPTVTVKGREYRLCCQECGDKIEDNPRAYLNKDGSLTRAWEPQQR